MGWWPVGGVARPVDDAGAAGVEEQEALADVEGDAPPAVAPDEEPLVALADALLEGAAGHELEDEGEAAGQEAPAGVVAAGRAAGLLQPAAEAADDVGVADGAVAADLLAAALDEGVERRGRLRFRGVEDGLAGEDEPGPSVHNLGHLPEGAPAEDLPFAEISLVFEVDRVDSRHGRRLSIRGAGFLLKLGIRDGCLV